MSEEENTLRAQIEQALGSALDRGALLREMDRLAQQPGFSECADLWAPALYQRDAFFFEAFLLRRLESRHAEIIRGLLPLAEAAKQDALFTGLYRKIVEEAGWNADMFELAQSAQSDEQVLAAIERRDTGNRWFTLGEDVALALYRRNPQLFTTFVQRHIHRSWWQGEHRTFQRLRAEAKNQRDDAFYWALFRELAEPSEWEASIKQLLREQVPASAILEELRKRHSSHLWQANTDILGDFVERYGAAVLPYIEENLNWIAHRSADRLLAAAKKLGDENLYWRIFFKAGNSTKWNDALRELLKLPLSDIDLLLELQRRTPPMTQRWHGWRLEQDVALAFYRRNPDLFRPFLEHFLFEPDDSLFQEAERIGDAELLDFLSFWGLRRLAGLIYRAFPSAHMQRWLKPDPGTQKRVEILGKMLTDRFDRLYATSPAMYVQHAANILSRFDAFEVWSFARNVEYNPAFAYLFHQHRDAWRRSASGIRELLESPNIYVQIIGLDILAEGGADAAERVIENLPLLRALLLGRAKRNTKRQALCCLEQAARQSAAYAGQIVPLLEEALYFQGKRAIDERVMVAFVRLRHAQAAQQTT